MTALTLPAGKTEADAIRVATRHREIIWRQPARDEDERIDKLVLICIGMCCNDVASGKRLASLAIYTPSP